MSRGCDDIEENSGNCRLHVGVDGNTLLLSSKKKEGHRASERIFEGRAIRYRPKPPKHSIQESSNARTVS